MKEKKSRSLRKVFLMAIATVLVIAISISATLAFLTDSTRLRDNTFRGKTTDIQGEILEPNFTEEHTYFYSPGTETRKDPVVHNLTTEDKMFTAIKLTFWMRVNPTDTTSGPNSDGFQKVSYTTFDKYVDVYHGTGASKAAGFNADSSIAGSKDWYEFTGTDSDAKYFAYKLPLDNVSGSEPTTTPIFDYVYMSEYINIPETRTLTAVANNATAIGNAGDNLTQALQYNQEFAGCDIKIKIEGYGIDAGDTAKITDAIVTNNLKPGLN